MKKLLSLFALGLCLSFGTAHAADQATCEKSAADKKLAGAAKDSHVKKCIADAGGAAATAKPSPKALCEKSAADKKLAGAAKDSHIKKCIADAEAPAAAPAAAAASAKK